MLNNYNLLDMKICETTNDTGDIAVYINPNENEKKYLIDELKIDEHTLSSALDPDELSRLEFEPDHVALIFKHPKSYSADDKFLFKVSSLGLFLFKNRLVILMSENVPLFDGKLFTTNKSLTHVVLKVMQRIISNFLGHLRVINVISEDLEDKINKAMENRNLLNLFVLEKSMVYYLNAINSNGIVIEKIRNNAAKIDISTELLELLDDIHIENNQCYKQAEIYSNILTGLMDARGSIVGNNLNVLMKTLNIITIGIMVPTFVVSAFSMNVKIPLSGSPAAFLIIMGMAAVSVISFMLFWKFKKW